MENINISNDSIISKTSNNFSFAKEFYDEIYSNIFKSSFDLYMFSAISAITNEVGEKIYENILHYIDNICNIDLCKCSALLSMLKMVGINYNIFNIIKTFPNEIINIIDILSIKKEYLLNSDKVSTQLISLLSNFIDQDNYNLSTITNDELSCALSSIFTSNIENVLNIKYYTNDTTNNIASILTLLKTYDRYITNDHNIIEYTVEHKNNINLVKIKNYVKTTFNERLAVDNIDAGISSITDYSLNEQEVIKVEQNYRALPYENTNLTTRYKYYKEKKLNDYINFIEHTLNLSSIKLYDIDIDYIYNLNNEDTDLLYKCDCGCDNNINIDTEIIENCVNILINITLKILELRSVLKTYVQRNFMKGNFLLISYTINEYLKLNNIIENDINIETKLIEYNDTTNYFNISTDIDNYTNSALNPQYWTQPLNDNIKVYIDNDTTDIFNYNYKYINITCNNNNFNALNSLNEFYKNILKLDFDNISTETILYKHGTSHINNFLHDIYDYAANKTILLNDNIITFSNSSISAYDIELFKKFTCTSVGTEPYYYHNNTIHPSYLIHPYLFNYIEDNNFQLIILDSVIYLDLNIYQYALLQVNNIVDDLGYLINIHKNPLNFNESYLTNYEIKQQSTLTIASDIFAYDGIAYPKALKEFLKNPYSFLEIYKFNNIWYKHLDLSYNDTEKIKKQLLFFEESIRTIATTAYDIYKYGKDLFGNMYFLLKRYDTNNDIHNINEVDDFTKHDTAGELWIRFKDNPIPFPAITFNSDNDEYEYITKSNVSKLDNILLRLFKLTLCNNLRYKYPKIYDFFISKDQSTIVFECADLNDNKIIIPAYITATLNIMLHLNIEFKSIKMANKNNLDLKLNEAIYKGVFNFDDNVILIASIIKNNNKTILQVNDIYTNINDIKYNNEFKIELQNLSSYTLNDISTRCQIDVHNDIMYIGYLSSINLTSATTYFGANISSYNDISNIIDTIDETLIIESYNITDNNINKINNDKLYKPFTEMGFYPLIANNYLCTNNISQNDILYLYFTDTYAGIHAKTNNNAKFLIISNPINSGITFRHINPFIKTFDEVYSNVSDIKKIEIFTYLNNNKSTAEISCINYLKTHSLEINTNNIDKKDILGVYTYTDLSNYYSNELHNLNLRINDVSTNDNKFRYDPYVILPYLVSTTNINANIFNIFTKPGNNTITSNYNYSSISSELSNNLVELYFNKNAAPISVTWTYYDDTEQIIKLDFNSIYYYKLIAPSCINYYNYQHTFLNLDKPGEAGYLKLYNSNIIKATDITEFDNKENIIDILYIKNISDTQPKFILSAQSFKNIDDVTLVATNNTYISSDYTILVTEDIINNNISPLIIPGVNI